MDEDIKQSEQQPTEEQSTTLGSDQLTKAEKKIIEEHVDYKDLYLRAVADYDNLKKETLRLRQEYAKYAAIEVVGQIMPVFENLKKALAHAPAECAQWVEGIKLIYEQFSKILESAGVVLLGVEGENFDPIKHEALLREKRSGIEADKVAQVIEPGYKMHEKILKPAKVIIAE
jgi:molecular chaperone GrpE